MATEENRKRNIIPCFEDLKVNEWYAITINPCDKYQHFRDPNRIGKFLNTLEDLLFHTGVYKYKLWVELSPKGRLHLHGKIKIINKVNFYTNVVNYLTTRATVVIKTLEYEQEWFIYCNKQWELHDYIRDNHYTSMPLTK